MKKTTPRKIKVTLLRKNDIEKILKTGREQRLVMFRKTKVSKRAIYCCKQDKIEENIFKALNEKEKPFNIGFYIQ